MGHGGKGGASSGAERSSRKQVTFVRPTPKFLQELRGDEPENPLAAKRETATHHLGRDAKDRRSKKKDQDTNVDVKDIEELEKQGFKVVVEDDSKNEEKESKKSKPASRKRKHGVVQNGRATKKRSKLGVGKAVLPASRRARRIKLSFDSDSDSSADSK